MHKLNKNQLGPRLPGPSMLGTKVTRPRLRRTEITGYPTIVYVPENIIKQIDDLFFDFIWPSGKHHVKKKVLIQEIESGGLKMPDISSMLKAVKLGWLKRLCAKETLYTHFASSLIG